MENDRMAFPRYRYPLFLLFKLSACCILRLHRSFRADAVRFARGISAVDIEGELPDIKRLPRGCVITINHYSRKGFGIWWAAIALSALLPTDICWVITSAWNGSTPDPDPVLHWLSGKIIRGVASVYGMITMPPMPPRPSEVLDRSLSIRQIVSYMKTAQFPVLGYAPEGLDSQDGELASPPPGFGRLIQYLSIRGTTILPVGIYERNSKLTIHVGTMYQLDASDSDCPQTDVEYSRRIMGEIRRCLPTSRLWSPEEPACAEARLTHP